MPTIKTIGYEKTSFADFVRTLHEAKVEHILDIRELPLSRRAGFSKRQLAAGLLECGIEYSHLKGLGTPKEGRLAARAGRKKEFQDIFARHMKTERAQNELAYAKTLVEAEKCCLLCFEADERCCHRFVVADALKNLTGLSIEHLHVSLI